MKKHQSLLFFIAFISGNLFGACPDNTAAVAAIESAALALGTTSLGQADFASGTYRIKTGGYYKFRESVDFNPDPILSAARPDKPANNWFAAITVETSANVVIDLNGFTISESQAYINGRQVVVFAIIELDNSVFPGNNFPLAVQGGFSFIGDTMFVAAQNVVVKNGTVTRSGHWGIHGSANINAHVRDVIVNDCQVAPLEFGSPTNCSIYTVDISGLKQVITVRGIQATVITAEEALAELITLGVPGAGAQLVALQTYVAANPAVFNSPVLLPEGDAFYGIFIGISGTLRDFTFPTTAIACAGFADMIGEPPPSCMSISNVTIHDMLNAPIEVPAIGSNQPPFVIIPALAGIIGVFRWEDAYDSLGNYNPNAYLQALAFTLQGLLAVDPPLAADFPSNISAIIAAILAGPSGHAAFLANVLPTLGTDIQGALIKGMFAIRYDCANNGALNNIRYSNIQNLGAPGIEVSSLPDGAVFAQLPQTRYAGNDVWALEMSACTNCTVNNQAAINILTTNGESFGFDAIQDDANVTFNCCTCTNSQGMSDSQTAVNTPSEAYGFRVRNNAGPVPLTLCTAFNTQAPRIAFGLATEGTTGVTFTNCAANNTFVTATDPFAGSNNKTAYGFYSSQGSTNTLFELCIENNARVLGETGVTSQTPSIAAGYVFTDADQGSTVDSSVANNNHSGGGVADGVRIDMASAHTTVSNNTLTNNIADLPFAQGFGVQDTAVVSTATLINNTFSGNSTANVSL